MIIKINAYLGEKLILIFSRWCTSYGELVGAGKETIMPSSKDCSKSLTFSIVYASLLSISIFASFAILVVMVLSPATIMIGRLVFPSSLSHERNEKGQKESENDEKKREKRKEKRTKSQREPIDFDQQSGSIDFIG